MKQKDINECYELTGVDPRILANPKNTDIKEFQKTYPKVYQWFLYWEEKKTNPKIQFSDFENIEFDVEKAEEARNDFFKPITPSEFKCKTMADFLSSGLLKFSLNDINNMDLEELDEIMNLLNINK